MALFPIKANQSEQSDTLFVIEPYRHDAAWVFDESAFGLRKEPFVAGVTEMIDRLVAGIPNAAEGFCLFFMSFPFPGYQTFFISVSASLFFGYLYPSS